MPKRKITNKNSNLIKLIIKLLFSPLLIGRWGWRKNKKVMIIVGLIIICVAYFGYPYLGEVIDSQVLSIATQELQSEVTSNLGVNTNDFVNILDYNESEILTTDIHEKLKVHFIDVGQADSILIQTANNKNMLIDAGNNNDSELVCSYLSQNNVKKLDVLVGTHLHEDHIGGMDAVIDNFDIGNIYMPKDSTTTKTFRDVLTSMQNKGLKSKYVKAGDFISFDNIDIEVLNPIKDNYSNRNGYSIVLKMDYGNNSFLFTGDAEAENEKDILSKNYNIDVDVLKVGHHGSDTSSTEAFLKAVSPEYAIIMVGDNNYGHPNNVVLDRLDSLGAQIYRTDKEGTIVMVSDGNFIEFSE